MHTITATQWLTIRDALAHHYGLYLDESRRNQACNFIMQRCSSLNISPTSYQQLIQTDPNKTELQWLAEQLANHETMFFRNGAQFRALEQKILPELHTQRTLNEPIKCWSAGCATGEEAYSIAMVVAQLWGVPPLRPVQIWATDVSATALRKAEQGIYRGRTLNHIPVAHQRWMIKSDDSYRIHPNVQSLVQFEQHNLLDPFPQWVNKLDLILCQNVTIYFQLATCRALIERMYQAMSPGGYLLLGFSESLWGIFDGFEIVEVGGAFVYRKPITPLAPARNPSPNGKQRTAPLPRAPARPVTRPLMSRSTINALPDPTVLIQQAQGLRDKGEQRQALATLLQIAPNQRTPAVLALAAQLHADIGQVEQAAAEARRALELDVMQETAYIVLGMIELQQGEWGKAAQYLERALYLVPQSPVVSFHLAESYRQQGRRDAARREYQNTVAKLRNVASTTLYEGVTAEWIKSASQRWIASLE